MLLDLGLDPNAQADTGRVALHGAAHKGATDVVQVLADHGAKLDVRDYGNTDNRGGKLAVHTWQPVDYADGLVRVGVQSAIAHPETGLLLRKLMTQAGFERRRWAARWNRSASPTPAIRVNDVRRGDARSPYRGALAPPYGISNSRRALPAAIFFRSPSLIAARSIHRAAGSITSYG